MKYGPAAYSDDIQRLELAEAETWFDYLRAEREQERLEDERQWGAVERWKKKTKSLLARHRRIRRDILFLHRERLFSLPRDRKPSWVGYMRGEAANRVEVRHVAEPFSILREVKERPAAFAAPRSRPKERTL